MAYLRNKVGITDPKKAFHSFRHTATDALWKAQVMESIIEKLTGRAGKTETSRRYPSVPMVTVWTRCIGRLC